MNSISTSTFFFISEPNPPENLNITVRGGREIDADWSPPMEGMVDNYTLFITSLNTTDAQFDVLSMVLTETYYRFTSLHPGESYNISVRANSGNAYSDIVSDVATTGKVLLIGGNLHTGTDTDTEALFSV